jgi:glycosyltransferase involved in cell wall biosynthesis
MKLLYLMTEPFGIGGVQSDILTLSDDMAKRGHEVFVATTPGVLLDELKATGARHLDIDFHYHGAAGLWRALHALRRAVREYRIDLVAPQSVRSTIIAFLSLRAWPFGVRPPQQRVPIVTTIHNIHDPRNFAIAGHILQRCADYVIFESNYERDRLLANGLAAGKSSVIHSGIDTRIFAPGARDTELATHYGLDAARHRVFGIVARVSEEKGHRYLLEAFAQVHRDAPNCRLLIVGDGPLLPAVRAQASALRLDGAVTFTGMQRNVAAHLSLFDAFVLSSTRESFPLAAREAMAAGKAVVAPRIGGCPEVVDDGVTGYLFQSRNVEQLAHCMREVVRDDRHVAFGRAARERVERLFSRRSWVEGDERVYLERLGGYDRQARSSLA